MDPEVVLFFKKIMNTFALGICWLMLAGVAGAYFKLAIIKNGISVANIFFYILFAISLAGLVFIFYRLWRKNENF